MEKKKIVTIIEIVLITLFVFIWGGPAGSILGGSLNVIDEGQYLAWIQHMLSGDKMYKDIYITYGPLNIYPLFLLIKIITPTVFAGRLFLIISTLLGVFLVSEIMKKLEIRNAIRYLGIIFLLILPTLQLRQSMGLASLYLLILCIQKYSYKKLLGLGVVNALTFLVSPDIGFLSFLMSFGYLTYLFISEKRLALIIRMLCSYSLGFLGIISIFAIWAVSEGWFSYYASTTIDVLTSFSSVNIPNGKNFPTPELFNPLQGIQFLRNVFSKEALLYYGIIIYCLAILISFKQLLTDKSVKNISFFLLTVFGFLLYQVVISRSGIGHFFFVLAPLLIILLYFLDRLFTLRKSIQGAWDKRIALLLIILLLIFLMRLIRVNTPAITTNFKNITDFQKTSVERVGPLKIPQDQAKSFSELQVYINKNTKITDKIFIFSNEPALYFLLNRNNPTRFDLPYIAITKEKRYELLSDLRNNKPLYIIENTTDWPVDEVSNRRRLPEIVQFINQNYKKEKIIGDTILYKKI